MNIKQRQREALTKERQHRMATGGGPSISDPDVAKVVPALIVGIDTAIDFDAVLEDHMVQPIYIEEVTVAAPVDQVQVVTETPPETSTPTSMSETAPSVPSRRPMPLTGLRHKDSILEREYKDCQMRAIEKHEVEMKILHEQLREAKAKADLAELILQQKQQ